VLFFEKISAMMITLQLYSLIYNSVELHFGFCLEAKTLDIHQTYFNLFNVEPLAKSHWLQDYSKNS